MSSRTASSKNQYFLSLYFVLSEIFRLFGFYAFYNLNALTAVSDERKEDAGFRIVT